MSKLQSFVNLPSAEVISRCDQTIKLIDEGRIKEIEDSIKHAMKPRERFFLLKLFGAKPLVRTREEAEAFIRREDEWGWSLYEMQMRYWEPQRQHCLRIKDLANTTPDGTVSLTAKDLARINGEEGS